MTSRAIRDLDGHLEIRMATASRPQVVHRATVQGRTVQPGRLWDHTSDELMQLPMPDLALLVLGDFLAGDGWNFRNWLNLAAHSHAEVTTKPGVMDRLAGAWAWLDSRAFVSTRHGQTSADARRVTDEGRRALEWASRDFMPQSASTLNYYQSSRRQGVSSCRGTTKWPSLPHSGPSKSVFVRRVARVHPSLA